MQQLTGSVKFCYLNPFDESVVKDFLYHLTSLIHIDYISYDISQTKCKGDAQYDESVNNRLKPTDAPVHNPIKRNKLLLFKTASKNRRLNMLEDNI